MVSGASTARAVIFDLDGVLTDTAEFHYRAWRRLADELGVPFDRPANEKLRGLSRTESLLALLEGREIEPDVFEALLERKNGYYQERLREMTPADTLPGAAELVSAARRRGLKLAVGSSSKNARFVLDRLDLTGRFDVVVDGHAADRAKPAPDLFLVAAERLHVAPSACIVIEDAAAGIDAALAASMTAVGVGPPERVGHAHLRFDTTAGIDLERVLAVHDHRGTPTSRPNG